jgi:iron(III) transport system substrate-binding protein
LDSADASLNDPDDLWAAIDVRFHAIATRSESIEPVVTNYNDLKLPELKGRLCLSSSELHANRSLLAMLIGDRGLKQTERLVRGWIRNLAASPFPSEEELLEALGNGMCDYAIVASQTASDSFVYLMPEPMYVDIDAIGVARHASNPEGAQQLVDWFLVNKPVRIESKSGRQNIGNAGWRDEDARLLAERAGYR